MLHEYFSKNNNNNCFDIKNRLDTIIEIESKQFGSANN